MRRVLSVFLVLVYANSTASVAGITVGDIIKAIDGFEVLAPEAVVAAIGKHNLGLVQPAACASQNLKTSTSTTVLKRVTSSSGAE